MRVLLALSIVLALGNLTSCAGYRFGGNKPAHLEAIRSIDVPLAQSHVIFPRVEALTTNSVIDALLRDGTYRLSTSQKSDATLILTLDDLAYRQARSTSEDVLRSEELQLEAIISYKLFDNKKPGVVLEQGKGRGRTRFFIDDNLQTARANALHDALQRAAQAITNRLADGI